MIKVSNEFDVSFTPKIKMEYNKTKMPGSLLFIGSIQFILSVILSEVLYSGYNASSQTISSLGVGPFAVASWSWKSIDNKE